MTTAQPASQTHSSPPENPRLVEAMHAIAGDDNQTTRKRLYAELLESTLLLPTAHPLVREGHVADITLEGEQRIPIRVVQDSEGSLVWALFTDEPALAAWGGAGSSYMAMSGRAALALGIHNKVAEIRINPMGPVGGGLSGSEIRVLSEGGIPEAGSGWQRFSRVVLPAGTKIMIGAPAKPPSEELLGVLRRTLSRYRGLKSAYLYEVAIGPGTPHLCLGICSSANTYPPLAEIASALSKDALPLLFEGQDLDIIELDDQTLRVVRKHVQSIL